MSTQDDGEGLAEVFVKGIVFTFGAALAGLILRRVFRQKPEVVVVAVSADELARAGELDGDGEVEVDLDDLGEEDDR
ncbi:hypothetical protein [Paraliomyxa miuraensis]|uniref:hypothetical protein n=1 Tax=Paraliomyxa miuraensis TaxID=376150 RepID=UPI0022574B74|nr:hypothetical protein [Paraliomyxa miuraensis]MCX4239166.1 hypothetical protein [Paraliomyxa miuraensis]MCX4239644.1 hypothetical protein [Paraliomyxa miuraensis]